MDKTIAPERYASLDTLSGFAAIAAEEAKLASRESQLRVVDALAPERSMQDRLSLTRAADALNRRKKGLSRGLHDQDTERSVSGLTAVTHPRVTMSARMTRSIQELSLSEKRLVSLAGTKLYGTQGISPLVTIAAAEYSAIFGTSMQQAYQELQSACGWDPHKREFDRAAGIPSKRITFCEAAGTSEMATDKKQRRVERKAVSIAWVQVATYNLGSGSVELRFANDLVPHLRNITERFGQYLLENTKGLRNMAAWRLVDLCSPHHLGHFVIQTTDLMSLLEVTERQRDFKVFSREVLVPATKALNARFSKAGSDPLDRSKNLHLEFSKVRGNSATVTHLEFRFNPNRLLRANA